MITQTHRILVRNLGRHSDGYWIAEVAAVKRDSNETPKYVNVHLHYGSWMMNDGENLRDLLPEVAAELQTHVLKKERKSRREPCAA